MLFELVRPNQAPLRCELRFCGPGKGWELRFLSGSTLLCSSGSFGNRASAIRFAEEAWRELED
jgi:hypothetical protein